jgi:hypothetical protein
MPSSCRVVPSQREVTASATWRRWVCAGHVDQHPGAALGGQPGCINSLGGLQGSSCVAEFHRDGDLEQLDVGRAELGVVVVAARAEPGGHLPGALQVPVGRPRLAGPGRDDGTLQRECPWPCRRSNRGRRGRGIPIRWGAG